MSVKNVNNGRRTFIKSMAAAAVAPAVLKADVKQGPVARKRKIVYRTLGKTGLKVPVVSLGAYHAINMIRTALDEGIMHIDTSSAYKEGNHERMVGEAFKGRDRDSFVIGTSFGIWRLREAALVKKTATPEALTKSFEGSLERLGLDYIDIYYLGGVYHKEIVDYKPILDTMMKFKKSGKAKFLGITTHANEAELIRAAADSGVYDVVLTKYNFRMQNIEETNKAIDYAVSKGLGIVAMKTQAGVYWDRTKKHIINQTAALKWALQNENIHTAIPSFSNYEEMVAGLSVMENLKLTEKEKADLQPPDDQGSAGIFCQQCEKCLSQCREPFDIPSVMRSYMYAYGYGSPAKARETLDEISLSAIPCADCDTCSVDCTMGFNVKGKVLDITRLRDIPAEFIG